MDEYKKKIDDTKYITRKELNLIVAKIIATLVISFLYIIFNFFMYQDIENKTYSSGLFLGMFIMATFFLYVIFIIDIWKSKYSNTENEED